MATNNLITIVDEVKALILALNDNLGYFDERGASNVLFHLPRAHEGGDLRITPSNTSPSRESRRFVVVPVPGFDPGRWDGTEAPVIGQLFVQIRYYWPASSLLDWEHAFRMATRDAEVIGHAIMTHEWSVLNVGDIMPRKTNGLQEDIEGVGIYISELPFEIEYHYDGS